MKRVTLLGPECSGKTTLARELAEHYGTVWSEEFARTYTAGRSELLTAKDVEPIARGQQLLIDESRKEPESLVIHDTDLLSTAVYAQYYYGLVPRWIRDACRIDRCDLYLLLSPLEMVADDVRDDAADRQAVMKMMVDELLSSRVPWVALGGGNRRSLAIAIIDSMFGFLSEDDPRFV